MSSDMTRRINIRNLATKVRIGIHPHEKAPQRVLINATIEGRYPSTPKTIADCFDYDPVHTLVVKEWPTRPHVDLLETYASELLEFIFTTDRRVTHAKVSVCKPDIFSEAEAVGVEAEWTRADFEQHRRV